MTHQFTGSVVEDVEDMEEEDVEEEVVVVVDDVTPWWSYYPRQMTHCRAYHHRCENLIRRLCSRLLILFLFLFLSFSLLLLQSVSEFLELRRRRRRVPGGFPGGFMELPAEPLADSAMLATAPRWRRRRLP